MSSLPDDPLLKNARREAIFVACAWLAAMVYTIGYCAMYGYSREPESLKLVFGFPDWVFWGIVVPWIICVIGGIWFSYFFMKNDDLSEGELKDAEMEERAGA